MSQSGIASRRGTLRRMKQATMAEERYDLNGPVDVGEAERLGEGGGQVSRNCETILDDDNDDDDDCVGLVGGERAGRIRRSRKQVEAGGILPISRIRRATIFETSNLASALRQQISCLT